MNEDNEPETRICPGCNRELQPQDGGYIYFWDCDHDECGWFDCYYQIYDVEVFYQVKDVQMKVGQEAAERIAYELTQGVLS